MILDNPELVDHSQAVALTYVEAYTLRRNDLDDVLAEYPIAAERISRAAKRVTMQRAMLKYLAQEQGKDGPRSVALKSHAKGYVTVHEVYTTEQKVDQMFDLLLGSDGTGPSKVRATIADPDGSKALAESRQRRASFSSTIQALSPTPSGGGGGGDPALAAQVAQLSGQVSQLLSSQTSMADAISKLSAQIERMQSEGGAVRPTP